MYVPTRSNKPGKLCPVVLSDTEQQIKDLLVRYSSYYDTQQPADTPKLVTRITGGWVRDKLLGLASHDLDIAINNISGLEFAEGLNEYISAHAQELGIEPKNIHKIEKNPEKSKHLETATTRLYGSDIDFVNLRSEQYADDSRIPETAFGTAEQDAFRRDATLNALFYNLQEDKVEDFTGRGLRDLEDGILRTPLAPFQTFDEDPLRVLRLMRFASTFGFELAPECLAAMKDPRICQALLKKISRERVGIEISKALTSDRPQVCLGLVQETGLYHAIFNLDEMFHPKNDPSFGIPTEGLSSSLEAARLAISDGPAVLTSLLAKNKESRLHFWLCVALNPWEGVMAVDEKQKPITAVNKVVRDGLKLSTFDAVTVAKAMSIHLADLAPLTTSSSSDVANLSRCELGLLVRKCGEQWALFFLYSLFKDLVTAPTGESSAILQKYHNLVQAVVDQDLTLAWQLKPILNGKELAKLYGCKGGQWLNKALQHLVEHQLVNPAVTKDEATVYMASKQALFFES